MPWVCLNRKIRIPAFQIRTVSGSVKSRLTPVFSSLKESNIAVGEAHEGFCRAKRDVEVLERELKETGALEKFESA
jgi:hypothetical protein